ncbi:MAG: hypothetical protein ACE5HS_22420 [bacterium]
MARTNYQFEKRKKELAKKKKQEEKRKRKLFTEELQIDKNSDSSPKEGENT